MILDWLFFCFLVAEQVVSINQHQITPSFSVKTQLLQDDIQRCAGNFCEQIICVQVTFVQVTYVQVITKIVCILSFNFISILIKLLHF